MHWRGWSDLYRLVRIRRTRLPLPFIASRGGVLRFHFLSFATPVHPCVFACGFPVVDASLSSTFRCSNLFPDPHTRAGAHPVVRAHPMGVELGVGIAQEGVCAKKRNPHVRRPRQTRDQAEEGAVSQVARGRAGGLPHAEAPRPRHRIRELLRRQGAVPAVQVEKGHPERTGALRPAPRGEGRRVERRHHGPAEHRARDIGRAKLRGRTLPATMPKMVTVSRDPAG